MKRLVLILGCLLVVPLSANAAESAATPAPAESGATAKTKADTRSAKAKDAPNLEAEGMAAVGAAMKAASEAPKGNTPCESAYNGMKAMMQAMEKQFPGAGANLPERSKFVAECSKLPPEVQKCLDVNYALAHMAECDAAQQKLDPETKARLKSMGEK